MARKMAKYFILCAIVFFFVGIVEGLMFPSSFKLRFFYAKIWGVSPEYLKPFFDDFLVKIHTHITLVGWVSSALMGILYFMAPQISGVERYFRWAAYGNLGLHFVGLVLMTAGFRLLGVVGLSAGHMYGSPGFRSVAEPLKWFVILGGIAVAVSGLLFALNMVRTLCARSEVR
jgi:heme/copper-type cytochrome/quinol oxidase subunit 1